MEFRITEEEAGRRLDQVLSDRVPSLSRMRLRQALDAGEVRVEGEPQPSGRRVRAGDTVRLDLDLDQVTGMTPEAIPIPVLYEDADLAVVEKPAGMVVHPAGQHRSGTLVNALAHHFNVLGGADPPIRPGLVHRLDRATSGLMVVAKNQRSLSLLTQAFQQKRVEKAYLALVHGMMEGDAGEDGSFWSAPIGSDPKASPRWGVREDGRPARTRYRVRRRYRDYTLLELEPITGRTNQLRLHCAHFGHPIVGDELFGRGREPGIARLFLHAYLLAFPHPTTGAPLRFERPLPARLQGYLDSLPGSR